LSWAATHSEIDLVVVPGTMRSFTCCPEGGPLWPILSSGPPQCDISPVTMTTTYQTQSAHTGASSHTGAFGRRIERGHGKG